MLYVDLNKTEGTKSLIKKKSFIFKTTSFFAWENYFHQQILDSWVPQSTIIQRIFNKVLLHNFSCSECLFYRCFKVSFSYAVISLILILHRWIRKIKWNCSLVRCREVHGSYFSLKLDFYLWKCCLCWLIAYQHSSIQFSSNVKRCNVAILTRNHI